MDTRSAKASASARRAQLVWRVRERSSAIAHRGGVQKRRCNARASHLLLGGNLISGSRGGRHDHRDRDAGRSRGRPDHGARRGSIGASDRRSNRSGRRDRDAGRSRGHPDHGARRGNTDASDRHSNRSGRRDCDRDHHYTARTADHTCVSDGGGRTRAICRHPGPSECPRRQYISRTGGHTCACEGGGITHATCHHPRQNERHRRDACRIRGRPGRDARRGSIGASDRCSNRNGRGRHCRDISGNSRRTAGRDRDDNTHATGRLRFRDGRRRREPGR